MKSTQLAVSHVPADPGSRNTVNSTSKPSILDAFYTGLCLHIAKRHGNLESNNSEKSMEILKKGRVLGM
jgi:hypothetical protein